MPFYLPVSMPTRNPDMTMQTLLPGDKPIPTNQACKQVVCRTGSNHYKQSAPDMLNEITVSYS